jgi:hypothetical protein
VDSYHRQQLHKDYRAGRDCRFCQQFDPEFTKRNPIDRSVQQDLEDSANSHLSENGHIRHRLSEIARLRQRGQTFEEALPRSA